MTTGLPIHTIPGRAWRKAGRLVADVRFAVLKLGFELPRTELSDLIPNEAVPAGDPILDHVCMPPYFGTSAHDDLTPVRKIVRALQPSTIIEFGTAHGNLTANLCAQCPSARIFTVNAPAELQTGRSITYKLQPSEIGSVYREHGFASQVSQIFENTLSLELSTYLKGRTAELAIIDACHDTAFVLNDFFKLIEFIRPGGLILFHDTALNPLFGHLRGSYLACMLLRLRRYDIRQLENTWWGVWRKPDH